MSAAVLDRPSSSSSGLVASGGRLIVCAFDPGETTGWSWHCAAKESLLRKGTAASLREMRPDVELKTLDASVRDLDLGMERGQFGKGDGLSEDGQVDRMMELIRGAWGAYDVEEGLDTFAVVAEDFILRMLSMDRNLLTPVRLNAKLERDMRGVGFRLHLQSPSDAKQAVTDARLKLWNVYDRGSGVHARDAQRHGILFLRRWSSQPGLRKVVGSGSPVPVAVPVAVANRASE